VALDFMLFAVVAAPCPEWDMEAEAAQGVGWAKRNETQQLR